MEEAIDHDHQHTLSPREARRGVRCSACWKGFSKGEAAYECSSQTCRYRVCLHEECADMPRAIKHPMHPQHVLTCVTVPDRDALERCAICRDYFWEGFEYVGMRKGIVLYACATSGCQFYMHLGCATCTGMISAVADADEEKRRIKHPSHPPHELSLLRRRHSFRCDACGTIDEKVGINSSSYVCVTCQFWIHESCASLPTTFHQLLHHHPLSLAFRLPENYIRFDYKCDICREDFLPKHWVYHCHLCSYVVHIKCAINAASSLPTTSINNANAIDDDEDVIQFPINDVSEELIRPFVERQSGGIVIPCDDGSINGKYAFHNHRHQLNLISLEENNVDDDDDDDSLDHSGRSKLICDGCITPIYQKKLQSSSSSSSLVCKYMSCGECKFLLHWACFHLPSELPSLSIHQQYCNHKLMLQTCSKLDFRNHCRICGLDMNGLFYRCTKCNFKADIKCASLPDTIKHAAHPQHHLSLKRIKRSWEVPPALFCSACGDRAGFPVDIACYICDSCEFILHVNCVLLPAANEHRWDKHLLPLTYDANMNHPQEFYCDICEFEMNPKKWMYHCRQCDQSFHPHCFPTTSGRLRNIKFGQQYVFPSHNPHHPLTFQVITPPKRLCDRCGVTSFYGERSLCDGRGLQCASCKFAMCLHRCISAEITRGTIEAID